MLAALLLSAPVFGANSILIQKGNHQYIIIPDCQVSEDVEDVRVSRLSIGAPIHMKYKGRAVRCKIKGIIQE